MTILLKYYDLAIFCLLKYYDLAIFCYSILAAVKLKNNMTILLKYYDLAIFCTMTADPAFTINAITQRLAACIF